MVSRRRRREIPLSAVERCRCARNSSTRISVMAQTTARQIQLEAHDMDGADMTRSIALMNAIPKSWASTICMCVACDALTVG